MKIYTVFGEVGDYSDRDTWPIASYFSEDLAKEHVTKATEKANEIYVLHNVVYRRSLKESGGLTNEEITESRRLEKSNNFDSEEQEWLDRHSYYYETTEILGRLFNREEDK